MAAVQSPKSPQQQSVPGPLTPLRPLTKMQVIFDLGGDKIIKDNLVQVLKFKDCRFYGSYKTAVTALRAAIEIPLGIGKLLLDSATWQIDLTSSYKKGYEIVTADCAHIWQCFKTTIILPFLAIGGLAYPETVFGLLENMSLSKQEQDQVAIAHQCAMLAKLKTSQTTLEKSLVETQSELTATQNELAKTRQQHEMAAKHLEEALVTISSTGKSLETAQQCETQLSKLTGVIAGFEKNKKELESKVDGLKQEQTTLQKQLTKAKEDTQVALDNLQKQINDQKAVLAADKTVLDQLHNDHQALLVKHNTLESQEKELKDKTLPGLEQQRTDLQEAKEKLEAKIAPLKEEIKTLQEGLRTKNDALIQLESQVAERRATLAGLEQKQTQLRDTVIPDLETKAKAISKKNTELETALSLEETKLQELKNGCTATQSNLADLERNLATKRAELQHLEKTSTEDQAAPKEAPAGKDAPVSDANLQDKIAELRAQLQTLEQSIAAEKQKETALKVSVAEQSRLLAEGKLALENLGKEKIRLEKEAELFKKAQEESKAFAKQKSEKEEKALQDSLKTTSDKLQDLEGKRGTAESRLAELNKQIKGLEDILVQKNAQAEKCDLKIKNSTKEHENLRRVITETEESKKELNIQKQAVIDALKGLRDESKKAGQEKAQLENALTELRKQEQDLNGKISQAQEALKGLSEKQAAEQATFDGAKKELDKEIAKAKEELERFTNAKNLNNTELEDLRKAHTTLNTSINLLKNQEDGLKASLVELQEARKKAEDARGLALDQTQKEIERQQNLVSQSESLNRDLDLLRTEQGQLEPKVQTLREQKEALGKEIQSLSDGVESKKAEKARAEKALEEEQQRALEDIKAKNTELFEAARKEHEEKMQALAAALELKKKDFADLADNLEQTKALDTRATSDLTRKKQAIADDQKKLNDITKSIEDSKAKVLNELNPLKAEKKQLIEELKKLRLEVAEARTSTNPATVATTGTKEEPKDNQ